MSDGAACCRLQATAFERFDPPTQFSECLSGPLSTSLQCSHPRPRCLISYICHRLLSANRILMPLVKTCRGGLGSAPACPCMADFPELHCLFLLKPDEQKQKYALHHSHSTVFCLPMKKCEANSSSSVPIFTQDTIHTMGKCCELAYLLPGIIQIYYTIK